MDVSIGLLALLSGPVPAPGVLWATQLVTLGLTAWGLAAAGDRHAATSARPVRRAADENPPAVARARRTRKHARRAVTRPGKSSRI